jgi:hypothetical protein
MSYQLVYRLGPGLSMIKRKMVTSQPDLLSRKLRAFGVLLLAELMLAPSLSTSGDTHPGL